MTLYNYTYIRVCAYTYIHTYIAGEPELKESHKAALNFDV